MRRLRLLRRWDQSHLAERSGLSTTAISQLENGRVAATDVQVDALAAAFGCTAQFLTLDLGLIPTTRPWLRAYADASRREADARGAAATMAVEYIRRLGMRPLPDVLPLFDGELDDDEALDEHALVVRDAAEIAQDSVVTNAIRAAERLGCVVLPLESELGRHLGMSVRADGLPVACVASRGVPGDRQRFTIAHELGHLTLHWNVPPPRNAEEASTMERQAHRFAGAFLAPTEPLLETLHQHGGRVTLNTLAELKAIWGIAIKALVMRLRGLEMINPDHARSLYKQISARRWNKEEPVHVEVEQAQWFARSVLRAAGSADLPAATKALAATVGGRWQDLYAFVDWHDRPEADVVDFAQRRRRARPLAN